MEIEFQVSMAVGAAGGLNESRGRSVHHELVAHPICGRFLRPARVHDSLYMHALRIVLRERIWAAIAGVGGVEKAITGSTSCCICDGW